MPAVKRAPGLGAPEMCQRIGLLGRGASMTANVGLRLNRENPDAIIAPVDKAPPCALIQPNPESGTVGHPLVQDAGHNRPAAAFNADTISGRESFRLRGIPRLPAVQLHRRMRIGRVEDRGGVPKISLDGCPLAGSIRTGDASQSISTVIRTYQGEATQAAPWADVRSARDCWGCPPGGTGSNHQTVSA